MWHAIMQEAAYHILNLRRSIKNDRDVVISPGSVFKTQGPATGTTWLVSMDSA